MFSVEYARRMYAERGPVGFIRSMHSLLGLRNKNGIRYRDSDGRPVLESQSVRPDGISLKGLAMAIFGEQNIERRLSSPAPRFDALEGDVLEAGNDIVPSQFADITAYNETVAGLLEVKILEAYNRPDFLASKLTTNVPSNKVQEKFIGISTPADVARERLPGQQHPRAQLTERWVTTPITKNRANAVDVTREAIMFDLTRQLMEHAELVSQTLALRKEYLVWDMILGITNDYTYDGTSYYTYVASGGYWTNVLLNDLVDWTCLDSCFIQFSQMTDQETGQPISVDAHDLIVMPARLHLMQKILGDTQVRQGSLANTTDVGTPLGYGKNPIAGQWNQPLCSQYAWKRLTDATGANTSNGLINLINTQNSYAWSAAQKTGHANSIWLAGNFQKAFVYIENLPLTITRAAPTSYEMADRGLVFSMFIDEMGIPAVKEPRYVIRNQDFAVTTANWANPAQ